MQHTGNGGKPVYQIQLIHESHVFGVHVTIYDSSGRTAMHKLTRAAHLSQSEKIYPFGNSGAPNGWRFSVVIACGPGSASPTLPGASISLAWYMHMHALVIHEVAVILRMV